MSWVYVIGGLLLIFAMIRLVSAFKLSNLKLMSGSIAIVSPDQIPAEQVDALVGAEQTLLKQGFEYRHHVSRGPVINGLDWGLYGVVYYHYQTDTWALCFVEQSKHLVFNWKTIYLSVDGDRFIVTDNGDETNFDLSSLGFIVSDPLLYPQLEHWRFHRRSLKAYPSRRRQDKDISEVLIAFEVVYFQGLVETGVVVPYEDGYRLPFIKCFSVLRRVSETQKLLITQKNQSLEGGELEESASGDSEYAAYQAYKKVSDSDKSGWVLKTTILLVSVLLFGLSFGLNLSFETLLLLIVVLFVHESGHLFGMWIFGYKDLRMLFVPFLGALASGKKDNITAWQEAIVLLLGPMPGYVLGIAILFNGAEDMPYWLIQYAIISTFLNALNLLPFMPLDGGRIVNLALFNRLPIFQLFLSVLSVAAFVYIGVTWGEWVMLVLGILLLIGLPYLWKEIQLFKYLLKQKLHKGPIDNQQLLGVVVKHPVWQKLTPQEKWPLVDSLSYRVQHAGSSAAICAVIFLTWVSVIVLPLYFSIPKTVWATIGHAVFLDAASFTIEGAIEDYENAETEFEKLEQALLISSWAMYEEKNMGIAYWEKAKEHVASSEVDAPKKGPLYEQMSLICHMYEDANCSNSYTLTSMLHYEQMGPAGYDAYINQALGLAQNKSNQVGQSLIYLDKAEQYVTSNTDLESRLAEIYFVRGMTLERGGDSNLAEEYLIKSIRLALEHNTHSSTHYQRNLLNFYAIADRENSTSQVIRQWLENKEYRIDEWTPLSNNLLYIISWRLIDLEPVQAGLLLNQIQVEGKVDQIELMLAKGLVNSVLQKEPQVNFEKMRRLIISVEDEYEWGYLASKTIAKDLFDEDMFEQDVISADWYKRMTSLLKTENYMPLLEALEAYKVSFGEQMEASLNDE